jgi:hypothetical protein
MTLSCCPLYIWLFSILFPSTCNFGYSFFLSLLQIYATCLAWLAVFKGTRQILLPQVLFKFILCYSLAHVLFFLYKVVIPVLVYSVLACLCYSFLYWFNFSLVSVCGSFRRVCLLHGVLPAWCWIDYSINWAPTVGGCTVHIPTGHDMPHCGAHVLLSWYLPAPVFKLGWLGWSSWRYATTDVSWLVCLFVGYPPGAHEQIPITVSQLQASWCHASLWQEGESVVYNCCRVLSAQSLSGLSPMGLMTIFFCFKFHTLPISRARSPYLYSQEKGRT